MGALHIKTCRAALGSPSQDLGKKAKEAHPESAVILSFTGELGEIVFLRKEIQSQPKSS